jgi:hypothetical protein
VTAAKTAAETDRTLTDKLGLTLAIFCAGTPSISADYRFVAARIIVFGGGVNCAVETGTLHGK